MHKQEIDPSFVGFVISMVAVIFRVLLIISVTGMIGIETTSFVAAIGAAGLAIGLALPGSLANFASGVLNLFFRPFKVGYFIKGNVGTGTVEHIDILHTTLNTPENIKVIIPNGQLSNHEISNYSQKETRGVDFTVGIGCGSDIQIARNTILEVLNANQRTFTEPAPVGVLTELGDNSLNLSVKAWVRTCDYWDYYFESLEKVKVALDNVNINIPYPQRDVHIYQHLPK